jgi:hypothetical protein
MDFLILKGVVFMNPFEYYRQVTVQPWILKPEHSTGRLVPVSSACTG